MENFAANSAFFIASVIAAVGANSDEVSVTIVDIDSVVGVNIASAFGTDLVIVDAGGADVDFVAVMIDSSAHFVDKLIVAATIANCVVIFEAGLADTD